MVEQVNDNSVDFIQMDNVVDYVPTITFTQPLGWSSSSSKDFDVYLRKPIDILQELREKVIALEAQVEFLMKNHPNNEGSVQPQGVRSRLIQDQRKAASERNKLKQS